MVKNTELEQILKNDELGQLIKKAQQASIRAREEFKEVLGPVEKALLELTEEQHEQLRSLGSTSKNIKEYDVVKASEILGVPIGALRRYLDKSEEISRITSEILDYDELQETWEELLQTSPIEIVDGDSVVPMEVETLPRVIFYSASWCKPCKLRKPMYARLAPFFEKAQLFFTEDEELATREGVNAYPTLVAYFPGGSKVQTSLPLSIKELWETMNKLVDAGKSFKGNGLLVCTETECKIEPW